MTAGQGGWLITMTSTVWKLERKLRGLIRATAQRVIKF
jgi:hypothetical protein